MKKQALLLALTVLAGACASARARTEPVEQVPLVVPPVPPRVIELPPSGESTPFEPIVEIPSAPANPPRQKPTQRDPARGTTQETKPEGKPPETPPETVVPPPTAQPVLPLRPQGTAEGPEMARQVRETLERAKKMLETIDVRTLSSERKKNYDIALDFIKQAENAITEDKLVFAKSLADRAEQLARQLGGR